MRAKSSPMRDVAGLLRDLEGRRKLAHEIRRGLCERPEDWPWSSASYYADGRPGPLAIDRHSLPDDPRP